MSFQELNWCRCSASIILDVLYVCVHLNSSAHLIWVHPKLKPHSTGVLEYPELYVDSLEIQELYVYFLEIQRFRDSEISKAEDVLIINILYSTHYYVGVVGEYYD